MSNFSILLTLQNTRKNCCLMAGECIRYLEVQHCQLKIHQLIILHSVSSVYQKQQSVVHKGILSTQFSYLRGVLQYIKIVV